METLLHYMMHCVVCACADVQSVLVRGTAGMLDMVQIQVDTVLFASQVMHQYSLEEYCDKVRGQNKAKIHYGVLHIIVATEKLGNMGA